VTTQAEITTARAKVYTTGQIAKLVKVAPRTVSKWFDSGRLRGYRIPGSQDRRVPEQSLLTFLREYGLPTDELEHRIYTHVLIVGSDQPILFTESDLARWRVTFVRSAFDAGLAAARHRPHVVAVDLAVGRIEAGQIAAALQGQCVLIGFSQTGGIDMIEGFDVLTLASELVAAIRAAVER
jgi:excisionase family DNA binding protein